MAKPEMKIIVDVPPNFEAVKAVFPSAVREGVLFCYGDKIYNPSGLYVPPEIIRHEAVHGERQLCLFWTAKDGREFPHWSPEEWWKRYLAEPEFRFSEELFAHAEEYNAICERTKNKSLRRDYLDAIARRLSGPLYNNMATPAKAREAILEMSALMLKQA